MNLKMYLSDCDSHQRFITVSTDLTVSVSLSDSFIISVVSSYGRLETARVTYSAQFNL